MKILKRTAVVTLFVAALPLVTWSLSRLKPAAPTVDRSSVWIGRVERGAMLRAVRGLGSLVPEEVLWIPALNEGRVERVYLRPGVAVTKNTVLMELSNPELTLAMNDFEWQVKMAEANLIDLKVRLESEQLERKARAAQLESEYTQAKLKYERDEKLAKDGLTPELNLQLSRATAEELAKRLEIEKKRLEIAQESIAAQLASQRVHIEKLRAQLQLKREQVDQLKIRAGAEGVLQELSWQPGQRVTPGAVLAKVAQPQRLKAELKIAETQAKDIVIGQLALIDTRNGTVQGRVSRIDPAVVNGTVTVDVRLEGSLPDGARPDLTVDGSIEIERLKDVLYVGRPVFAQPNSVVTLFRLEPGAKEAVRVQVRLGRASVNTIEVLEGLKPGDEVILSDMSAWDAHNRIRLN
ncbi:MAG: efflux RND transporter periplasmic adaptor subunit [Bryobacteraceae bacterium]|nr:efflux RND transporter periplasmic adaptor subunit [Bryobacteraceae bacterium]MDW8377000.1 efflux RND transporter periplasmic adaptor subunit [Bryobacterales bacterium]